MIPKWARPGSHTWLGLFIVFAIAINWVVGAIFAAYFALYERWEANRLKDKAYKDIAQGMWGIATGTVIWGIAKLLI